VTLALKAYTLDYAAHPLSRSVHSTSNLMLRRPVVVVRYNQSVVSDTRDTFGSTAMCRHLFGLFLCDVIFILI
jgi:hypothetical protein